MSLPPSPPPPLHIADALRYHALVSLLGLPARPLRGGHTEDSNASRPAPEPVAPDDGASTPLHRLAQLVALPFRSPAASTASPLAASLAVGEAPAETWGESLPAPPRTPPRGLHWQALLEASAPPPAEGAPPAAEVPRGRAEAPWRSLPPILHSSTGIQRVAALAPAFLPLLLQALLREAGAGEGAGETSSPTFPPSPHAHSPVERVYRVLTGRRASGGAPSGEGTGGEEEGRPARGAVVFLLTYYAPVAREERARWAAVYTRVRRTATAHRLSPSDDADALRRAMAPLREALREAIPWMTAMQALRATILRRVARPDEHPWPLRLWGLALVTRLLPYLDIAIPFPAAGGTMVSPRTPLLPPALVEAETLLGSLHAVLEDAAPPHSIREVLTCLDHTEDADGGATGCSLYTTAQRRLVEEHAAALHGVARRLQVVARNELAWSPLVALGFCYATRCFLEPMVAEEDAFWTAPPRDATRESISFAAATAESHPPDAEPAGGVAGGTPTRETPYGSSRSTAWLEEFTEAGVLLSPSGRTGARAAWIEPAEGPPSSLSASRYTWRLPAKVPSLVTPPHTMVMTCMVLSLGKAPPATVASLGQWLAQALLVSLVTPSPGREVMRERAPALTSRPAGASRGGGLTSAEVASPCVALTHLLQKHHAFLSKASFGLSVLASLRLVAAAASRGGRDGAPPSRLAGEALGASPAVERSRFTDVVVRLAALLSLRLVRQWATTVWPAGCGGAYDATPALQEPVSTLQGTHCVLHLLLQAVLVHAPGQPWSPEAQNELGELFLSLVRLTLAVDSQAAAAAAAAWARPALHLLRQSLRWVALAVDEVLHRYAAGCPLHLCERLAELSTRRPASESGPGPAVAVAGRGGGKTAAAAPLPRSSELGDETRCGGESSTLWDALRAAGYLDAFLAPLTSIQAAADLTARVLEVQESSTVGPPPPLTHAPRSPTDTVDVEATDRWPVHGATATDLGERLRRGGLLGFLPSSGEPLELSGRPAPCSDGGLPDAQKQWWASEAIRHLDAQWWAEKTGVGVGRTLRGGAELNDVWPSPTSPRPSREPGRREWPWASYIDCCPHTECIE